MAILTRVKEWVNFEVLEASDLNAEFDAIMDNIIAGTTESQGVLKLEDSHASTSTTKAACPKNVKEAYDKAVGVIAEHSDITSTGANIEDAVTKKHAANGDTALGAQSENLNMNTHKIVGVTDPTTDQEAATKKFVDDKIKAPGEIGGTTPEKINCTVVDLDGGQIAFPATAVPHAGVNVLDDYEEGTFTPVLAFGGNSVGVVYSSQLGWYTKIGQSVKVSLLMVLTNKGTSVGNTTITGLPFTALNGRYYALSFRMSNISFADFPQGYIAGATSHVALEEITNAGVLSNLDDSNFANNSAAVISGFYETT